MVKTGAVCMLAAETGGGGVPAVGHSTAIILDEVNSYFEDAYQAQKSVAGVMGRTPADERIALYAILRHRGLVLFADYTTDRDALRRALASHRATAMRAGQDKDEPPRGPMGRHAADFDCAKSIGLSPAETIGGDQNLPLWDTPLSDCQAVLHAWPRNADDPRLSLHGAGAFAWDKTFHALNEANAAVNTIDTRGAISYGEPATGAVSTMIQIAERTGGKARAVRESGGARRDGLAVRAANCGIVPVGSDGGACPCN